MAGGNARKSASKGPVIRQVPAVTRAVAILKYLARVEEPAGVVQLADALGIIPSTCLHILRVLHAEGLVSCQAATKKYQLGAGVLAFAKAFESKNAFIRSVRPYLEDFSNRHHCTAVAVEPDGNDHFIVVAAASTSVGMSVSITVGTRVPAMLSATGRCLAAFGNWTLADLRVKFTTLRWQNPPKFETWYKEVQETRRRGYGVDSGNYIRGVTVIATPVFDDKMTIIGGLACVQLSDHMNTKTTQIRATELQQTATRVSLDLGYRPNS